MPHTPHRTPEEDQPLHVIVTEEFAEVLRSRHEARNAKSTAQGHGPVEDTSPFITRAELEEKKARLRAEKLPRGRLSHAARLKIAARTDSNPSFARHARKCAICRHPEVERIEDFFVSWSSSAAICKAFKINGVDAVYRHARATGLDVARRQNARFALEKLIEEVDRVHVTSSAVVRAVRALSCIDERGHWTDPPSTHIFVRGADAAPSSTGVPQQAIPPDSLGTESVSNRLIYEELEVDVTHTKEDADADSNR